MERITSRSNERLVRARKVRDGADRSLIFVEGKRLAEEALRSDLAIRECLVSDKLDEGLTAELQEAFGDLHVVADKPFESVTDTTNSQGVVVLAERPTNWSEDSVRNRLASGVPLVVYLDHVNNPSNLGAIIRTVEAAGAIGIMTSSGSADAFSPKALRGSMGSAFRLPILEGVEFEEAVALAAKLGLTITAAENSGGDDYISIDWTAPRLLVLGSEAHGLSAEHAKHIETSIRIPIAESVESLNLGVAAGIILFEARRRCGSNG